MIAWLVGLMSGALLWTLLEYSLHRFAFHRKLFGKRVAKEHLLHHARVDYFASAAYKAVLAVVVLTPIVGICILAMGALLGTSIPVGVLAGYAFYEVLHRRIHTAAPLGAYGRWARRHHLLHHFGRADANHGVTSPLWDVVFGTLAPRETIRVPRQHAAKFPWLFEGRDVAAAFAAEYRVV